MTIVDDLLHLFPDEIVGQPGTTDHMGNFSASGAPVAVKARFEGGPRLVRDPDGQEQVSTLSAIVAGTPGFAPTGWRFTIPIRFAPNVGLAAINVLKESDENAEVYEEVLFP